MRRVPPPVHNPNMRAIRFAMNLKFRNRLRRRIAPGIVQGFGDRA